MDFNNIYYQLQKPGIFTKSTSAFWDDEHISKGMLEAHLNPQIDAASRNHQFIDSSVSWIISSLKLRNEARILDLGCGPGLYAERFALNGYKVTGIDFSRRSVDYARNSAKSRGLSIEYNYMNYLDINFECLFDCVILIYCDFGVLSDEDRDILLGKVYKALKPGGYFIFDVFTPRKYTERVEANTCFTSDAGFWSGKKHICFESFYIYKEQNVFLEQYVIVDETGKSNVYRVWDHVYTEDNIDKLLRKNGFTQIELFADVAGKKYYSDTDTICVLSVKER